MRIFPRSIAGFAYDSYRNSIALARIAKESFQNMLDDAQDWLWDEDIKCPGWTTGSDDE